MGVKLSIGREEGGEEAGEEGGEEWGVGGFERMIRAEVVGPGGESCVVVDPVEIDKEGNCFVKFTPVEVGDHELKVF